MEEELWAARATVATAGDSVNGRLEEQVRTLTSDLSSGGQPNSAGKRDPGQREPLGTGAVWKTGAAGS